MAGIPLEFSRREVHVNPGSTSGRIAGIDFGTVRIGIAVSDPRQTISSPYENYTRKDPAQDARRFQKLVLEEEIVQFVVGLPIHLDGNESAKSLEARDFGKWLEQHNQGPRLGALSHGQQDLDRAHWGWSTRLPASNSAPSRSAA